MKITVRQLKQLIREQIEEGASPWGRDEPLSHAEIESRARQREIDSEYRRGQDKYNAEQRQRSERERAEREADVERRNREHAESQKQGREAAFNQALKDQGTEIADLIIGFLNRKNAHNNKTLGSSINKVIADIPQYASNGAPMGFGSRPFDPDDLRAAVDSRLKSVKIPNFGNKTAFDVVKMVTKKGWKPGLFGLGFMGLEEEIQQMVKEEVARQLRNKR
jgi:hypothetical protein